MRRLHILLMTILIASSSCNKILDKEPTDFIQPDSYYNNENDLDIALAAVYDPLGNEFLYGSALWYQFGICTDEGFYQWSANAYAAPMYYQHDFTNGYLTGIWQQCYIGIERANLLIANINTPSMDERKRQAILGEALFLRAYYHFLLVSNFGDVPLKITPTADVNSVDVPRDPTATVYAQIIEDMQSAETMVYPASEIGHSSHVSQTAVAAILARVNLYMAGYPLRDETRYAEVIRWATKVIESGEHGLRTTFTPGTTNSAYSQIFINQSQDIYDIKECLWEIDFYTNNNNSTFFESGRLGTMNLGCINLDTGYAASNILTTIKLYNLYSSEDQRRNWVISPFYFNSTSTSATRVNYAATAIIGRDMGKWRRYYEPLTPQKQQYYNGTNFPVIRYSDVLLMLAEAENEVNAPNSVAYEAINQVRRRGYGVSVNSSSAVADLASGLTKDEFRQVIVDERARELAFEALRKADLIRWGIFSSTLADMVTEINNSNASSGNKSRWTLGYATGSSSSKYLLFPIPSLEISINKAMTQNPGW